MIRHLIGYALAVRLEFTGQHQCFGRDFVTEPNKIGIAELLPYLKGLPPRTGRTDWRHSLFCELFSA